MVYSSQGFGPMRGAGGGLLGSAPRDIWLLLGVIFGTFTLQFFAATAIVPALLRLSPAVWRSGFVWQALTYPFIGTGAPSFWFLIELLILYLFGRDVFRRLGRRNFWSVLLWGAGVSAVAAIVVQVLAFAMGFPPGPGAFGLMQGQHMVLVLLIAAFATLYGEATIYLFFVLPIQAKWFLALEILFAFLGFLGSKDLAGFVGICVGVGFVWSTLSGRGVFGGLREARLRLEEAWLRFRLGRERRKRGLHVVKGGKDDDWIH